MAATTGEFGAHRPLAPVLWLTVLVVAVIPFLADGIWGRMAAAVLIGCTAVVALRRSHANRSVLRGGYIAVAAMVAVTILTREYGSAEDWLTTVSLALLSVLLLVTPVVVVMRLGARPKITVDSLAGLLAAYMQFGVFFAVTYRLIAQATGEPFFAGTDAASAMDYQFFSFVTLTTLGYGNLTPAGDLGQQLAIFEALFGQVFLVTVVGLAVGNLGASVPRRRKPTSDD
ncbi:MAG: potassium channel family protein [Microthrixaceae bacterium]